jgi:hypothetical protein
VNRFHEHSQVITTNNCNSLTGLHTLKIAVTTAHKIKSSLSAVTSNCLVTNLSLLTLHSWTLNYWTAFWILLWMNEWMSSKSKLYYNRWSAGQPVLEQSTHLGLTTRSWLLSDSCGFVGLGRPLWRADGSAVCNCYWPSPAQSFLGLSHVGLVAIFYCLRFETSFFVASYDLQGHGGGIRPCLHMGDEWIHKWTVFYNFGANRWETTLSNS